MDNGLRHDRKTKGFLWGTALTWALTVPLLIGVFNFFRGISEQKATGLGAIAGGLTEGYLTFGFILGFVLPVVAIVLLIRSFSSGHGMRTLFSILYIGWNALIVFGLSVCLFFFIHQSRTP
jgi:hypothetical protein